MYIYPYIEQVPTFVVPESAYVNRKNEIMKDLYGMRTATFLQIVVR